jgi:hypothetical protein
MMMFKVFIIEKKFGDSIDLEIGKECTLEGILYLATRLLTLTRHQDYGLYTKDENNEVVALNNMQSTVSDVYSDFGENAELVIKRRIFPLQYIKDFEGISSMLSKTEISFNFT